MDVDFGNPWSYEETFESRLNPVRTGTLVFEMLSSAITSRGSGVHCDIHLYSSTIKIT
jgi:hypothetical protein